MYVTDLNSRRNEVLKIIINFYVRTASPVGSRAVSRVFKQHLSPATIRNVMADLEEMALITQPYTSAGRVPTDKGYRFYVDSLMDVQDLAPDEKVVIDDGFQRLPEELEEFAEVTSRLLSAVTEQAALVLFPRPERNEFRLYYEGASNILKQPEFKDVERGSVILKALEEKSELLEIMAEDLSEGQRVRVHIGRENLYEDLEKCTLITTSYGVGEQPIGTFGILGPTRMFYSETISRLEYMSQVTSRLLTEMWTR